MHLSNVLYLLFGAIITILVEYFLVAIRETRETKRVKEIINAELIKNKKNIEKIKSKISKSKLKTLADDLIYIKKEIKQNPFLFFGREILKNKFSVLRIDADYFIDTIIIYLDLEDINSYIHSFPGMIDRNLTTIIKIQRELISKIEFCSIKIKNKD